MVCSKLTAVGVNVGANQKPRIGCAPRGRPLGMAFLLDAAYRRRLREIYRAAAWHDHTHAVADPCERTALESVDAPAT